jgi:hypothetical protein
MATPPYAVNASDITLAGVPTPTADTGNLRVLHTMAPSTPNKRVFEEASGMYLDMVDRVASKRLRAGDSAVARALTADGTLRAFASGTLLDTGLSTSDAQTDQRIRQTIMVKPYAKGYEQNFAEGSTLFCHKRERLNDRPGIHTVADVPTLNYFNELAADRAHAFANGALQGAAREAAVRGLRLHGSHLGFTDPHRFKATWAWIGNMASSTRSGAGEVVTGVQAADTQRTVSVSCLDRSYAFNLFGERVRRGHQLFFTLKPRDVSGNRGLVDPRGVAVPGGRPGAAQYALQLQGFSDFEAPPHDSSCADMVSFARAPAGAPHDEDADYVERAHRMVTEYKHIEWDESTDQLVVKSVLEHAGGDVQEARNEVNEIVYTAYMTGCRPYHLGVARDTVGRPVGEERRARAHRSQREMITLPLVEMYTGV